METVFGIPKDSKVIFCIDASNRGREAKRFIFEHIITHLNQMRSNFSKCKFNIILFGENVSSGIYYKCVGG